MEKNLEKKPEPKLRVPILRRVVLLIELVLGFVLSCVGWILSKVFFFWRQDRARVAEIYRASCISDEDLQRSVNVFGRLLMARSISEPSVDDNLWTNFRRSLKRWMTSECPYIKLRVECGAAVSKVVTDREGYFNLDLKNVGDGLVKILVLEDDGLNTQVGESAVLVNDVTPELIILSDVDDTIFVSNTAKMISMMKTSLFGNADTREIFDGVAELYRKLRLGADGKGVNPFAYVTSSPWNLHAVIERVFEINEIPAGSMFMTDWGLDESKWLKQSNHEHKLEAIQQYLSWYPFGDIILFGDSSQHDAEIYLEVLEEYGDRVKAVLIRDVTNAGRLKELKEIIPPSAPFCFHKDTATAEKFIAGKLGW